MLYSWTFDRWVNWPNLSLKVIMVHGQIDCPLVKSKFAFQIGFLLLYFIVMQLCCTLYCIYIRLYFFHNLIFRKKRKRRWIPQNSPEKNRRHLILWRDFWKKLLNWIFGAPKLQLRPKKLSKKIFQIFHFS